MRSSNLFSVSTHVTIDDFYVLKEIGKGAFGYVYKVQRKLTKDIYAMKTINVAAKVTDFHYC